MTKTSTAVYNKIVFVLQFHVRCYSWISSGANVRAFKFLSSTSLEFIFPSFTSKKSAQKNIPRKSKNVIKRTEILKSALSSALMCLWLKNFFLFLTWGKKKLFLYKWRKDGVKKRDDNHTLFKCAWSIENSWE